jgi:WD40 repeat protein
MWSVVSVSQSSRSHHHLTQYISSTLSLPRSIDRSTNPPIIIYSYRHHDHCVLFTGNKGRQHAIHYWSLHDNKILRKFRGHSDVVTDVSLNPGEDMFLTASRDRTVRLWNIQQAGCMAQMDFPSETVGTPHVAFDSTGMVFTVMAEMAGGKGNVSTQVRGRVQVLRTHPYFHFSSVWSSCCCCCFVFCFRFIFTLLYYYYYIYTYIIYYTHV